MNRKLKYNTPIRVICAIVFAIFSFLYIYMFQGELLALLQDNLSGGRTKSNALVAALIITSLLLLLQWGVNRLSKLHGRWEAVSYLPSCMLLALLTDVNDGTILYTLARWAWGVPLCIVIYTLLVWLNRMSSSVGKWGFLRVLWPNLAVLSLLFVLTGQIGNNATVTHLELAAWGHVHDGEYEKVLKVGARSDDTNAELTALRILALAKTGELGDRLFYYPQRYGADALIYNRYSKQTKAYGAGEYYRHLGEEPYGGESGRSFAERMYMKHDSAVWRELYLAALLLDKDLDAFAKVWRAMPQDGAALPVHYQEALCLYNEQHPDAPIAFKADDAVVTRFADYRALQKEYAGDDIVAKNVSKRKFGNSYWCYYDY